MRFAVLDLGSSSFNLLVAEVSAGVLHPLLREREAVQLGWAIGQDGRIPGRVADPAVETVARFASLARRAGADSILALATSALRDAPNRDSLHRRLTLAAGGPVRFLEGTDEARLIFAGLRASVALSPGPTLGLDLGGGSLELAVGDTEGVEWAETLRIGAARLTGELVKRDPPSKADLRRLRERIETELRPLRETVRGLGPRTAVATGGTAGAMARLVAANRWPDWSPPSLNQLAVTTEELRTVHEQLASAPRAARLRMPGVEARRVDLLPAGSLVLAMTAEVLELDVVTISDWGLREGAVLQELGLEVAPGLQPVDLRAASADALIRRWDGAPEHGERVAELSGRLFDETRQLHGLGPRERELLAHAARLHDVGRSVSSDGSHKHGAYLVLNAGLRGFSPQEEWVLASLVRFRRGSGPKASFEPFTALDAADHQAVVRLTGLLRIAHGLDRAPDGTVETITVEGRPGRLRIRVAGDGAAVALASAQAGAAMVEKALDCRVQLLGA